MTSQHYTYYLPYTPEQLYNLVIDIEKYPDFLPWCTAARILSKSETEIVADLSVGYQLIRETFRSRVLLTAESRVEIEYLSGPFHYLHNQWQFHEASEGGTNIDFSIDFKLKNSFFQKALQLAFESAFKKMLSAFEKRSQQLYDDKKAPPNIPNEGALF